MFLCALSFVRARVLHPASSSRCRPSEEPQTLGEDMDEEQSGQGNPNESVQGGAGLSTALEEAEEEGPGKQGEDAQGQHGGILMERGPPHEEWPAFKGGGGLYLTVNMRICECCTLFRLWTSTAWAQKVVPAAPLGMETWTEDEPEASTIAQPITMMGSDRARGIP